MILLYLTGTLLLLTALAITIGRLVQAQDDVRTFRYEPLRPGDLLLARRATARAWMWITLLSAALVGWLVYLWRWA